MRKIIVSNLISLDGYYCGKDGDISWFANIVDSELQEYSVDLINSIDTMLFGRVTYQLMESYWPNADPAVDDKRIIKAMNDYPKIVFSHTLDRADWKNTHLIKDNITDEVRKLKKEKGKDMVIYGSGSIVSLFTREDLVDEYKILVVPAAIGGGKNMFSGISGNLNLKLIDTKRFPSGLVLLEYIK